MKIEIVKFDNGKYGVRKTQWRNWLNPLLNVHQFLYLYRDGHYNPEVNDFVHWSNITFDNADMYQTEDLQRARDALTEYMQMVEARRRLKRAKKAVKDDVGRVVVV